MFAVKFGRYILQPTVIFVALSFALVLGSIVSHSAIMVAALGPTAFVLFITPHSSAATPRHLVGGHLIGLLIGSIFAIVSAGQMIEPFVSAYPYSLDIIAAASVTVCVLLMVLTRTEHAPAAATTLVVLISGFSWALVFFVSASIGVLCVFHQLIKPRLYNLV
jgi:CBS-domain-containing membrane protein